MRDWPKHWSRAQKAWAIGGALGGLLVGLVTIRQDPEDTLWVLWLVFSFFGLGPWLAGRLGGAQAVQQGSTGLLFGIFLWGMVGLTIWGAVKTVRLQQTQRDLGKEITSHKSAAALYKKSRDSVEKQLETVNAELAALRKELDAARSHGAAAFPNVARVVDSVLSPPPDPKWLLLTRQMRTALFRPYKEAILVPSSLNGKPDALLRVFSSFVDSVAVKVGGETGELIRQGWTAAFELWGGKQAYADFCEATESLSQPFTQADFEGVHQKFTDTVFRAIDLWDWFVIWERRDLPLAPAEKADLGKWRNEFLAGPWRILMDQVVAVEQSIANETGRMSNILASLDPGRSAAVERGQRTA